MTMQAPTMTTAAQLRRSDVGHEVSLIVNNQPVTGVLQYTPGRLSLGLVKLWMKTDQRRSVQQFEVRADATVFVDRP